MTRGWSDRIFAFCLKPQIKTSCCIVNGWPRHGQQHKYASQGLESDATSRTGPTAIVRGIHHQPHRFAPPLKKNTTPTSRVGVACSWHRASRPLPQMPLSWHQEWEKALMSIAAPIPPSGERFTHAVNWELGGHGHQSSSSPCPIAAGV